METKYLALLDDVLTNGVDVEDRTGIGVKSLNGASLSFDVSQDKFPIMTTKKIFFNSVVGELAWFLSGSSNIRDLSEFTYGVRDHKTIWHDNVESWNSEFKANEFDAGENYSVQWRFWDGYIDQISGLIQSINNNPTSRRHVVTAWNPSRLDRTCLPPCHILFQCHVVGDRLDMTMYQRSADMFLGVPFNITSYSLLLIMISHNTDKKPGKLTMFFGDYHIYNNHIELVKEQLKRMPYDLPQLVIDWDKFSTDKFKLVDYKHHGSLMGKMAV